VEFAHVGPWLAGVGDDLRRLLFESGGAGAYGAMVLAFLAGTVGLPFPEELILSVGGYLAAKGVVHWLGVYVLGYAVIFILDVILYELGRRAGPRALEGRLGRRLDPARVERIRGWFDRHGVATVVASRFLMGTRTPTFLLAGALGMPRSPFLLAVAVSGIVTVAIPIALGYFFAAHIDRILVWIERIQGPAFFASMAILAVGVLYLWRRGSER